MAINYIEIQNKEIKLWNITNDKNSTCWSRTHAHCDGTRRICKWKQANSYISLFTLLHEIGHIETDKKGMKRAEQESCATKWAVLRLKSLNIPIKRKVVSKYKAYTLTTYNRGLRRGLKKRIKSKLYI